MYPIWLLTSLFIHLPKTEILDNLPLSPLPYPWEPSPPFQNQYVWLILAVKCMFVSPQNVMILESGAYGKWFSHEGRSLLNRINALIKETPERYFAPSTNEAFAKKQPSRNRKYILTRHWLCLAPWSWNSHQNCEKYIYIIYKVTQSVVFFYSIQTDKDRNWFQEVGYCCNKNLKMWEQL